MLKFTVMVMLRLKFIIWDQVYFADRREKVDCKTTESAVARTVVTADHEDVDDDKDDDKEAGQLSKLVLVRFIIKIILMVVIMMIMILLIMAMLMIMMIIIMIMMIMKVSEMTMTMTRRLDRIGVKHLMWFT